jgi:hypothetical protein
MPADKHGSSLERPGVTSHLMLSTLGSTNTLQALALVIHTQKKSHHFMP